jgi:hypothetical protein
MQASSEGFFSGGIPTSVLLYANNGGDVGFVHHN